MSQLIRINDTIVAMATPPGQGGIGIVRLSGPKALEIVAEMFQSRSGKKLPQLKSHTVHYGWIVQKQEGGATEMIDEVLLTVMRAPRSYTCEDVVEISCHGGMVPLRRILTLAMDWGARLAEPGEFTKRAFLNGRLDLTQAEAVLDIIQAKTDAFLRVSTHQLKGDLSIELEHIRELLMTIYVELEAIVNFPEDDIDPRSRGQILLRMVEAQKRVERLLQSSEQGKLLKEGIKIVLCGKPNVGKSSLLNVLLRQPRAIVTEVAGTTRDTIEETAQIRGIPFQLVDTAGILEPRDLIEEEAIRRSHMSIERADLILLILDASRELSKEDDELYQKIKDRSLLVVINKCDLKSNLDPQVVKKKFNGKRMIHVSALKKMAIEELEEAIVEEIGQGKTVEIPEIVVSNLRHIEALKNCAQALKKAHQTMSEGLSYEFVSEEIKSAVNDLDRITGRHIDSDLLDRIFSQFCIGK